MYRSIDTGEAIKEARRCRGCPCPTCIDGCPLAVPIPDFMRALAEGNLGSAYEIIIGSNNLPAVCGRVCPHERQCEARCFLARRQTAVNIGNLEAFVADFALNNDIKPPCPSTKEEGRVAVIGSGPAGLTVAGELARLNYDVTIFEAQAEPGGVLLYGFPEYRLQKSVVRREIAQLRSLGVAIETGRLAGEDFTVDDLFAAGFDAIFIGSGTSLPYTLDLPGKELSGIQAASFFLRNATLIEAGRLDEGETLLQPGDNVVVVGNDAMAMEAARTALNFGPASVNIVTGRDEGTLACGYEDYMQTAAAGVQFNFLTKPMAYFNKKQMRALLNVRRNGDMADESRVAGLLLQNLARDEDGSLVPEGGQQLMEADSIILSVGHKPMPRIIASTEGLQTDSRGFVITRRRPYGMTTRAGVFTGVDSGPATVVNTMKESKLVAEGMAQYIAAKKLLADCEL